jgi:ATP-dependent helicase IRC3
MNLRPYQREDLTKSLRDIMAGKKRNLIVWATGLGKTVLMAHIVGKIREKRALIIVNREELVWQTVDKIKASYPDISVSVEKAEHRSDPNSEVVVASVQTIGSAKNNEDGTPVFSKRLQSLDPGTFDIVMVDECHRSSADSYRNVLKYFQVYRSDSKYNDPGRILFGLTATPNRSDNKGLGEFFDNITATRDIRWGIQNGYLADIEAYRVETTVDISDVRITAGEFNAKDLEKKINTPARNELVVKKYLEITGGKKALFFTVDIQHAEDLAAELVRQGVKASAVSSRTPDDMRRQIFEMHKSGQLTALCGANVFLEGYDDPTIEVGCMVRPFRSGLIYRQAVGRVLRPYPAPEALSAMRSEGVEPSWIKPCAIIIDYVDVSSRHSLLTVPSLFGLSPKLDPKGKRVEAMAKEMEGLIDKLPEKLKKKTKLEEIDDPASLQGIIERVDLISAPETPDEVVKVSGMSWIKKGDSYILNLPTKTSSIRKNLSGHYEIRSSRNGISSFVGVSDTLENAIRRVEKTLSPEDRSMANREAGWRSNPISDKQVDLLAKIDRGGLAKAGGNTNAYKAILRSSMSAGQAQALISSLLSRRL